MKDTSTKSFFTWPDIKYSLIRLDQIFPKVQKGKDTSTMMAESFDCVTIFYGEIVAFDKLISDCKADEVGGRKSNKVSKQIMGAKKKLGAKK